MYKTNGIVYYFLNDKKNAWTSPPTSFDGMKIRINGNGSNQNGESNYIQTDAPDNTSTVSNGRVFKWSYPCQKDSSWGLIAHTAAIQPGNALQLTTYNSNDHCIHGSGGNNITRDLGTFEDDGSYSSPYGIH